MSNIILSTLNARYIHSSLGLRYLLANMGALQDQTTICEYIINSRPIDVVEKLLSTNPKIIGFGVYIWNIDQTTQVVSLLKEINPEIKIIIGGPEVSHEQEQQHIFQLCDFAISGAADLEFPSLCQEILKNQAPKTKKVQSIPFDLSQLKLPYELYNDEDIRHRVIYVEASRGCPFKCEFCISALDKTAWAFDLDKFLSEMEKLYQRGARQFKFVDRTFNLKIQSSIKILEFFLQRMDNNLFLHFELIPDHLPEKLKNIIKKFPEGSLQFEIGIQSFNPEVQALISRKQNNTKSKANISWLRNETPAHLHTDLIMGLPGESVESIEQGFNQLVELNPHEIQMGVLKRLRGTPIIRHTKQFSLKFNPSSPYNILENDKINFSSMQRLNRFARYWDMIANSGRFKSSKQYILGDNPFSNFLRISDWLFEQTQQTHKIALPRLFELLYMCLTKHFDLDPPSVKLALWTDYMESGLKGRPSFADSTMLEDRKMKQSLIRSPAQIRQSRHAH